MTRWKVGAGVGLASALLLGATAFAEGNFSSSISGGRVGFQSRRWTDKHLDGVQTTIRFTGCRDSTGTNDPNDSATVHLWRDISFAPDEDRGINNLNCWVNAVGNYGVVPNSGSYYFQLDSISGRGDLIIDVPDLQVTY